MNTRGRIGLMALILFVETARKEVPSSPMATIRDGKKRTSFSLDSVQIADYLPTGEKVQGSSVSNIGVFDQIHTHGPSSVQSFPE